MPWYESSRGSVALASPMSPILNTVVFLYYRSDHHDNCSLKRQPKGHRQNKEASDIPNRVWKLLPCFKLQVFSPPLGKHPNLFHPSLLLAREIPTSKGKDLLGQGSPPPPTRAQSQSSKPGAAPRPAPGSGTGSFIPTGPHLAAQTVSPAPRTIFYCL